MKNLEYELLLNMNREIPSVKHHIFKGTINHPDYDAMLILFWIHEGTFCNISETIFNNKIYGAA